MFIFKSKEKKELEEKKNKEIKRQQQYKRVNVVFKGNEYEDIEKYLKEQGLTLTQYVKMKLEKDIVRYIQERKKPL